MLNGLKTDWRMNENLGEQGSYSANSLWTLRDTFPGSLPPIRLIVTSSQGHSLKNCRHISRFTTAYVCILDTGRNNKTFFPTSSTNKKGHAFIYIYIYFHRPLLASASISIWFLGLHVKLWKQYNCVTICLVSLKTLRCVFTDLNHILSWTRELILQEGNIWDRNERIHS